MKSLLKLIRKFLVTMMVSFFLLLFLNTFLFLLFTYQSAGNGGAFRTAEMISAGLTESENGYFLSKESSDLLNERQAWAILIDNGSGKVKWNSPNLPSDIPMQYPLSDLSMIIRGYIADYPTASCGHGDDLFLVGYPKDSYWKLISNTFDLKLIQNTPLMLLSFLFFNLILLFLIYWILASGILRSVRPIVKGIESLTEENYICVKEKGLLSSLAHALNKTAQKLHSQDELLRKKEMAQANWIAGVSHDIRTPLSTVLGYSSQLEEDASLSIENRKKAELIRQQSMRMKHLINDLNLASKLEYNIHPFRFQEINLISLLRQTVVDFLNMDVHGRYPMEWETSPSLTSCILRGDPNLIQRAVSNLVINATTHNPGGCTIHVSLKQAPDFCKITVWDNGIGVTDEQLESLRNKPHYMVCDNSATEQQHGLGLLIVKQIADIHHGSVLMDHSPEGGFLVTILLPILKHMT